MSWWSDVPGFPVPSNAKRATSAPAFGSAGVCREGSPPRLLLVHHSSHPDEVVPANQPIGRAGARNRPGSLPQQRLHAGTSSSGLAVTPSKPSESGRHSRSWQRSCFIQSHPRRRHMKWQRGYRSSDVIDRRGGGGGGMRMDSSARSSPSARGSGSSAFWRRWACTSRVMPSLAAPARCPRPAPPRSSVARSRPRKTSWHRS